MKSLWILVWALVTILGPAATDAQALEGGFVYLRDVAPTIQQDMRYFGRHNFIGRPIAGYLAPE
jgi:D-alanyl-D-alanine dipeptidase